MPLLLSFSYFLFYHKIFILDTPREFGLFLLESLAYFYCVRIIFASLSSQKTQAFKPGAFVLLDLCVNLCDALEFDRHLPSIMNDYCVNDGPP